MTMSYVALPISIHLMPNPSSQLLTLGGVELTDSRKVLDFSGIETVRVQYKGNLAVRIEYSLDWGNTWATLIPEDAFVVGNNPFVSGWLRVPDDLPIYGEVLLRCIGIGSGLVTTTTYVEMQYKGSQ